MKDCLMSLPETASRNAPFDGGREMADLSRGRIRRAIRTVRQIGLRQLLALVRHHGLRKSVDFAAHNIRHIIAHRLALRWDRDARRRYRGLHSTAGADDYRSEPGFRQ